MRSLVALLLFLFGCSGPLPIPKPGYDGAGAKLIIVVPAAWHTRAQGYADLKRGENFNAVVWNIEDHATPELLHGDLIKAKPKYVFLGADFSLIPTMWNCTQINWSPSFGKGCTYSDYYFTALDEEHPPQFTIGRLMTYDPDVFSIYALKADAYERREFSDRGYFINDRVYDSEDGTAQALMNLFAPSNENTVTTVNTRLDVVNAEADPFVQDNAGVATAESVSIAVDQGVDFISYYGHGAASAWGYNYNIPTNQVHPRSGQIIPLAFAMACETARDAPNPPWYSYYDVNGVYQNIKPGPPAVPYSDIPDPSPTQPEGVLNPSMGSRFTSDLPGGAMVYIGETVVTGPEDDVLFLFHQRLANAYDTPLTIGEIWLDTETIAGIPAFWQIVGDPSTFFR